MQQHLKIGLFGGTFDPVHDGHLAIAEAAVKAAVLDVVYWIASAQSPLKGSVPEASGVARLGMLQAALANNTYSEILDWEVKRGGASFTFDTIMLARQTWPNATFFWIMGQDQWVSLARWHRVEELSALVTFLVYRRPGTPPIMPLTLSRLKFQEIPGPSLAVSSTMIRQYRKTGGNWEICLPLAVSAYIQSHSLYLKDNNDSA